MKEILRILEQDGKATPEQIASLTGQSPAQVREAIAQAEKERAILKYKAVVNWDKAGNEQVWALIEVRVTPQRGRGFDAVAERIGRFPEVRSLYLVSGTYDLAVLVTGKTMHEVAAFVSEKLATLESIQATVTHFILKRYKEDGELLQGEAALERLPLVP